MRFIGQAFLIITILVLSGGPAAAVSKANLNDDVNRAEAERLWELVIKAKGGRERLHAVNNVHTISREKYLWWFRLLTIDYQSLNVFPDKSWEWDDQRGSVFGFGIYLHNFEKNIHLAYRDTGKGAAVVPIMHPSKDSIPHLQLHLLTETKWVQPLPQSFRREKLDGRDVVVIQTMVQALRKQEQKVDFALDRKTHLPLQVVYYWTRNGREFSGGVPLKDYVEVDGIKVPAKIGRVRARYRFNVEYDERIFEQPPRREAGPEAWKKK